jgi:hypothetical protein
MAPTTILLSPAPTHRSVPQPRSRSSYLPPAPPHRNPLARADAVGRSQKLVRPSKNAKLNRIMMRHQHPVAVAVGWKLPKRRQLRVAIGSNLTTMKLPLHAVAVGLNRTMMRHQRQAATDKPTPNNQNPAPLRNRMGRVINLLRHPNPNPRSASPYLPLKILLPPIVPRASKSPHQATVVTSIQISITDRLAPYQPS